MIETARAIEIGEFHRFTAAGQPFLYLVPSAAVFALDPCAEAVVGLVSARAAGIGEADIVEALAPRFGADAVRATVAELLHARAVREAAAARAPARPVIPLKPVPLQTLVVNVTNQCNLACTYCYEYGEDKIVDTDIGAQPKFMTEATARASVDFLLANSGPTAHLTFFGGETLLNFPVLKATVAYARTRAREEGKRLDFALTTNATLLKPEIIEFLLDEGVGVTISIDGPKEVQDRFRVFHGGTGSYEIVTPKIKALLARHTGRPIGARVTLTRETLEIGRIFRHLTEEVGFRSVGFAPVTTAAQREFAIGEDGYDRLLEQFRALAFEYRDAMLETRWHAFSNVRETLAEIHQGHAKAYPCGAGIGLMGVATDGQVNLCHRFAGSAEHRFGSVDAGIDRERQGAFLDAHHIDRKTDCATCWARPICSGGCYHEAHIRHGATTRANLHYCEWIRGWTDTCLEIYGELAVKNPRVLSQFDGEDHEAPFSH
ncbi:MAG: quinohemoprotein amine dehydrogenase maturation protein [Acidobacteriota bacterium]